MASMTALESQARGLALRHSAGVLDRQGLQTAIEGLRSQARQTGVSEAFDARLGELFPDAWQAQQGPPALQLEAGGVHDVTSGGLPGSALQFFTLQHTIDLPALMKTRIPALQTRVTPPVDIAAQFPALSAAQRRQAVAELKQELAAVTVRDGSGGPVGLLTKINNHPGLSPGQRARILGALAEVRLAYPRAGALLEPTLNGKPGGVDYQDVNWKHTRLEIDRVLDVALLKGLTPQETESALVASMFSDAVKAPSNFLVHNVHGAHAALHVLSRSQPPLHADQLEDILRATLEHQIGPPVFMAMCVAGALNAAGVGTSVAGPILARIRDPLNPRHHTPDGRQLAFDIVEQEALARIGIHAWTVPPTGARHERISRAVIEADSLVNYACPDGWAKLAKLHGPGQPKFLQEPTLRDAMLSREPSVASALRSFDDARAVVSAEVLPAYDAGLAGTQQAVEETLREVQQWALTQVRDSMPWQDLTPYLDVALDYGAPKQVAFAALVRNRFVELLRAREVPQ